MVYLPAGTYDISSTLVFNTGTNGAVDAGTRLIGANPTTTTIVWTGPAGGTMISVLGMQEWQLSRLTLQGTEPGYANSAGIILLGGGLASGGNFNSGNSITDDIFENATVGIEGGNAYGSVSETTVESPPVPQHRKRCSREQLEQPRLVDLELDVYRQHRRGQQLGAQRPRRFCGL